MVDIHAAAHGGDLTLEQFLLTGVVACGGLTQEQGNVWGGRSSREQQSRPLSTISHTMLKKVVTEIFMENKSSNKLPFCTVQWEMEESRVKECSGACDVTGGESLVSICLYFLLPRSILSGDKLN